VVSDLGAFLDAHDVALDRAESGCIQLVYRGECLTCPWTQVPGTEEEPNVAAVLTYLVAKAQTDERTDEDLRTLFGSKTHELLMSTRAGGEVLSVDQKTVSDDRRAIGNPTAEAGRTPSSAASAQAGPARKRRQTGAITNEQLIAVREKVEQAHGDYQAAVREQNKLVRAALDQGMRPSHIARLLGVSRNAIPKMR
jgi:hypothetical protein